MDHAVDSGTSFQDGVAHVLLRVEEHKLLLQQVAVLQPSNNNNNNDCTLQNWQVEWEDLILHQLPLLQQQVIRLSDPRKDHPTAAWTTTSSKDDNDDDDDYCMRRDLLRHVRRKLQQGMRATLWSLANNNMSGETLPTTSHTHEEECAIQGIVARLFELALVLVVDECGQHKENGENNNNHKMNNDTDAASECLSPQEVVDQYASYQRWVLRQRAKPAIAHLAQWRRAAQQHSNPAASDLDKLSQQHLQLHHGDDDDDSVYSRNDNDKQPHSHAMTVVLGQASALVHPLQVWKQQLPPQLPLKNDETCSSSTSDDGGGMEMVSWIRRLCQGAIQVLDEQAQSLTKTISDWFWEDRSIQHWMVQSSNTDRANGTVISNSLSSSSSSPDLAQLDAIVEEMAFGCQLLARYQSLIQLDGHDPNQQTIVAEQLLPEWTWTYAALERYLVTQQWHSAVWELACPVHIVIGKSLQVPSVVEDAQYLSTRALERATATRSIQAIGTVAHSLSHDIWSTDDALPSSVHQALLEQRGCWAEPEEPSSNSKAQESPSRNNGNRDSFASALLDALDDDLGDGGKQKNPKSPPSSSNRPPSAPRSGGLLSSLATLGGSHGQEAQLQTRLEMQLCALNGIQSASVACDALVQSLDALLQDESIFNDLSDSKATSMIRLAREELLRYADAYRRLLKDQVAIVLSEWCGSSLDKAQPKSRIGYRLSLDTLHDFFLREDYNLSSSNFPAAEADDRLERDMLGCLREDRILQNLERCEAEVAVLVCQELNSRLSVIILNCLWDGTKIMTDWGSLLLSKQVRLLQNHVTELVERSEANATVSFLEQWERVSQVIAVLQLEKPSDWVAYQTTNVGLTHTELRRTFHLRVDFSSDAIAAVCGSEDAPPNGFGAIEQ